MALCGLEETQTNNKIFNRAPRGIRSRTHTVYHADADNTTNLTRSAHCVLPASTMPMVSCAAMRFALAHPRRFEDQPGLPRRLFVFWGFLIEGPLLIERFLRNPYIYTNAQYDCGCPASGLQVLYRGPCLCCGVSQFFHKYTHFRLHG